MEHEIRTEADLDAPPAVVWRHLTDLAAYASWNPFVVEARGTVAVGQRLAVRLQPPGGRAMTFRPVVTRADGHVLEWRGRLAVPGLFDGLHRFHLTATATGTHLVHGERFRGLLVRPLRRSLDEGTRAGFEAANAALADRVAAVRA